MEEQRFFFTIDFRYGGDFVFADAGDGGGQVCTFSLKSLRDDREGLLLRFGGILGGGWDS